MNLLFLLFSSVANIHISPPEPPPSSDPGGGDGALPQDGPRQAEADGAGSQGENWQHQEKEEGNEGEWREVRVR